MSRGSPVRITRTGLLYPAMSGVTLDAGCACVLFDNLGDVMLTLSAWEFDTPHGADEALEKVQKLHNEVLLQLHDAAVVRWEPGQKKPKTRQLHDTTRSGAAVGGFWGILFGLLFLTPLLGMAIGAASGALLGSLRDVGISDSFIREIRSKITPGTSALFALTSNEVYDRIAADFRDTDAKLIHTNLSDEQEARLREAFDIDA